MKTQSNSKKKLLIAVISVIASMMILALLFFFVINRWSITLVMNGDDTQTIEYGDSYSEAGATARLHGSLIFKKGWDVPVTTDGTVDSSKVGTYETTYSAEKYHLHAKATRTIVVEDRVAPEITLTSNPDNYTLPGQPYIEEGYTAKDNYDGDLTDQVTSEEKDGVVTYTVSDSSGNETSVTRQIRYNDPVPPEITLSGDTNITIQAGQTYTEPGYTAADNCDGDLTGQVIVDGNVDTYRAGTYTLNYTVSDSYGNTACASRQVTVNAIRQPDVVVPSGKIIYLTFDDGPGPYTSQLLDTLAKYNVKATFFTVNTKYISLITQEAAAGHSVGIHSATHDYATIYASEDAYFADLHQMESIITSQTGVRPTLIRFPGGSSNKVSARYCPGIMSALTQAVTDQGYQYFDWNVSSGDAGGTTDTETVFENVINGVQQHNVSVVLQHDIKSFSVDAVEKIIVWGLANGYTFLPLDASSPGAHQPVNN